MTTHTVSTEASSSQLPVFIGDISPAVRDEICSFSRFVTERGAFARSTGSSLVLTEVGVFRREKDGKAHAQVTYQTTVHDDMLNIGGNMHGGCAIYMIDICSSMALAVLGMSTGKPWNFVSQAINTTFHAPVPLGAKIEVVNRTVSFGSRTVSATTEIWDLTNGRLCVTGVHNKMKPSEPKAKL
ncbi:HotDog domain-containing protein [Trametes gibbosa]|nr:HotDog domain-containing protein [Trametes gibbosa]